MHYWNDGADGFVWEPLYRKKVGLTACEQALLMTPAVRRLGGVAHYGASARILPMTHSRYVHTLGVFALVVHFAPEDWLLRLAAVLHDVGHLPFSHSAERGMGLDHHALTVRLLEEAGLNAIMTRHGFDPEAVLAVLEGRTPNPLAPGPGGMGLDHLDSFLRDTESCGIGETPAWRLLERLDLNGPYVEAKELLTAREIVRRVAADHRLFLKPRCIGLDTLVTEIFRQAALTPDELMTTGDEGALDLAARQVPDLVDRLRNRPWTVAVREDDGGPGWTAAVTTLYLAPVFVDGRPSTEALPEAAAVYADLERLRRTYKVTLQ